MCSHAYPCVLCDKTVTLLYIQLPLWNDSQEKINNITVTSLPRTALNINKKSYNVRSVNCHRGRSLYNGHYTIMIKKLNLTFICNNLIFVKKIFSLCWLSRLCNNFRRKQIADNTTKTLHLNLCKNG